MSHDKLTQADLSNTEVRYGLRGKMITGYFAVIMIFMIAVTMILLLIWRVEHDADLFLNHGMKASRVVDDLQVNFNKTVLDVQSLVVFHEMDKRKKITEDLARIDAMTLLAYKEITGIDSDLVNEKWSAFQAAMTQYRSSLDTALKLIDAGAQDKALEVYRSEMLPAISLVYLSLNGDLAAANSNKGLLDVVNDTLISDMSDIVTQVERMAMVAVIFMILAIILSYLIAHFSSKSIIAPLKYAINIARRIAAGEREMDISTTTKDETGKLIASLSVMHDAIKTGEDQKKQYAEDIMHACANMVSTLEEVRQAVDAQSSGASEQASSINQITASITEIEKSATQTMNKARDLGGVAEKTKESGQIGLESIQASVQGMKLVRDKVQVIAQTILDLSRQTQQVGEITAVVNNLAQQSKMLALNASIEAAKAGDAGKGFTVVASEVKNLAEQSEQSTSQVQKILEDIRIATEKAVMVTEEGTKGVDNGLQMIERTGDLIRDLNEVIREASIASQQIEAAVRQEGAGIEQITAGMNEINTVTSSFVDSTTQTTQAINDLSKVSQKLKSSVETYKI